MIRTQTNYTVIGTLALLLGAGAIAHAQTAPVAPAAMDSSRFSAEVGIGFDNGLAGHINASGMGNLQGVPVVITKNSYEDVYGTGLHFKFGGGYVIKPDVEARVTFTFQSLDADFLVPMGEMGNSTLYGQYDDYQSFGLDLGVRQYVAAAEKVRAYGEATLGIGFIDETDVTLVAPGQNFTGEVTDFYDQTASFAAGINVGALFELRENVGVFGQLGVRYMTGMSDVDNLAGTGLDTINDKSSRWTLPFLMGVRFQF
jgi:hypothetical protein